MEDKIHEIVIYQLVFFFWATSHANLETYNKHFNPLFCYLSRMGGMDGRGFLVWASILLTYYCVTNYPNICQLKTTFIISQFLWVANSGMAQKIPVAEDFSCG